jgi:hypothetical protein
MKLRDELFWADRRSEFVTAALRVKEELKEALLISGNKFQLQRHRQ